LEAREQEQTVRIMGATAQTSGKRRLARTFGQWAAAAATAALVLTGLGIEASADVVKQPDQGLSFEGNCDAWCQHEDGTQTVCSLEGTDCYHISSQSQPTGPLTVDDTQSVASVEAIAEAPLKAPVDLQDAGAVQSDAPAAPTEKASVQAEEPVPAAASEMQP
jgi:hypothetical protein